MAEINKIKLEFMNKYNRSQGLRIFKSNRHTGFPDERV